MGIDYLSCNYCGDGFPDVADYVSCDCGNSWCSEECAKKDNLEKRKMEILPVNIVGVKIFQIKNY